MGNKYFTSIMFNRLWYRALHTVCVCLFLLLAVAPASAQIYSTAQDHSANGAMDVQYRSYQSTVYQPFASSPSMISGRRNSDGAPSTGGGDPTNPDIPDPNNPGDGELPENWFDPDHPSDPGHQSNQSPVGEAWVMLFFAAVAALVVYIRRRRLLMEDTSKID